MHPSQVLGAARAVFGAGVPDQGLRPVPGGVQVGDGGHHGSSLCREHRVLGRRIEPVHCGGQTERENRQGKERFALFLVFFSAR